MIVAVRSLSNILSISLMCIIFLTHTKIFARADISESQLKEISVAILSAADHEKINDMPLLASEHEATLTLGLLAYDALQNTGGASDALGTAQEIAALQERLIFELKAYATKYAPTFLTKIPSIPGQDETVAGNLANWGTTTIETGLVINNNNGGTVAGPALQVASFANNQALLVTTTAGQNILQVSTNPNQQALSVIGTATFSGTATFGCDVILPAATAGASTSTSCGLLELGGANASSTNINLFEVGIRNYFNGNYNTVPNVSGNDNIAEGLNALAAVTTGTANIAIGANANTTLITANNTIAIGNSALATVTDSIAIGDAANASANLAIVIGSKDSVNGGVAPQAPATNAIAIGSANGTAGGASATSPGSIAIGSAAIGLPGASASGLFSLAIGVQCSAAGAESLVIGSQSNTSAAAQASIAIGDGTHAGAPSVVALGQATIATGSNAVAIGINASAAATDSIAMGDGANATSAANLSIVLGSRDSTNTGAAPTVSGASAIAIGSADGANSGASASAMAAVALGGAAGGSTKGAQATALRSVAIGAGSVATVTDSIILGNPSNFSVGVGIGTSSLSTTPTTTARLTIITSGNQNAITTSNGTISAPAYSFIGTNTSVGMYSPGQNQLALVASNTARLLIDATQSVTYFTKYKVHAAVTGTSPTFANGATNTIIFNTITFDLNNNYNSTTGVYSVPATGYYYVSVMTSGTTGGLLNTATRLLNISRNGATVPNYSTSSSLGSGAAFILNLSSLVQLNQNDALRITYTNNGNGADTLNAGNTYLDIHFMSYS